MKKEKKAPKQSKQLANRNPLILEGAPDDTIESVLRVLEYMAANETKSAHDPSVREGQWLILRCCISALNHTLEARNG